MATVSPVRLRYSAMFVALLSARSIPALSFWLTWRSTWYCVLALGLLGLVWAACLVWARAGAPLTTVAATAAAAAIAIANLLRRAMVMACSLDRPSGGAAARQSLPHTCLCLR